MDNNENRNENLSFITDEDVLTEIDFGSFLEETSKDATIFEGFHEDIEKTERSLESELQSLYDDIMSSGPATIVPKPMSVITSEELQTEETSVSSENGLSEMWMNPEEYMDIPVISLDEPEEIAGEQETVPEEAFFRPEPQTEEETPEFTAETVPEANDGFAQTSDPVDETEPNLQVEAEAESVAAVSDVEKDDIFGLIDSMKNSASDESGFEDILAEIEANTEIAPVANDYGAIEEFLKSFPVETTVAQDPILEEANEAAKGLSDIQLPVQGQDKIDEVDVVECAETEKVAEPVADSVILPEAEQESADNVDVIDCTEPEAQGNRINTNSEEFERELAALLGETVPSVAADNAEEADGGFVVNIPEDGVNFAAVNSVSETETTPETNEAQPPVFFDPNMVQSYAPNTEDRTERVVIGDFEAAKKAALEASTEETKEQKKERKKQEKEAKKNGEKKKISAGEVIRRIVLAISFAVMAVCAVILINTYLVQPKIAEKNTSEQNSQLEAGEDKYGDVAVDDSIRNEYDVDFPEGMLAKYAQLYKANPDLRGWISIPAYEINLPLVQAEDNDYYLKRNFYDKWVSHGVPFYDYRIAEDQFSNLPRNTVIYGHNMRSDHLIFGMLEEYREIDGFKRAPIIECNTIYGDYKWVVCGVFISNSDPKHDNDYVFPYNFIDCSDQLFAEYIVELEKRSLYNTGVGLEVTDKILTLSTCAYDFKDARLVVVARLLRPGESVNIDTSKAVMNSDPKGPQKWCDELNKPNNYADEKHWYID